MMDGQKVRSKLFMFIFVATAIILAWGAWNNYRPMVIYASCNDIASKSSNIQKRTEILQDTDQDFDIVLNDCLSSAGYY